MEELRIKMETRLEFYEDMASKLSEDNRFKIEYEAKAEELKHLLSEMGGKAYV